MADRFPSIEDFDEGANEAPKGDVNFDLGGNDDPTSTSFLERERAALGEEFTSSGDALATTVEDAGDDDLLGGGGNYQQDGGNEGIGAFESSFPAIDTSNDHMAPGGTITGSGLPYLPTQTTYAASSTGGYPSDEPEPEVIREWRERRDLSIQHRDEVSSNRKDETIKNAQEEIDAWYEKYNTTKEKNITRTRREAEEFLNSREDTTAGGTSWERIAKLVDISGKGSRGGGSGSGKDRFRELLISLRKDEGAPGATGY